MPISVKLVRDVCKTWISKIQFTPETNKCVVEMYGVIVEVQSFLILPKPVDCFLRRCLKQLLLSRNALELSSHGLYYN